ncbi:MAG: phosphoribosylformylglycinamidine synthase subunit PurS [Bacillota bacterium]|jgi:phosphoribosylformylglycinamidine synthase PurS subunit
MWRASIYVTLKEGVLDPQGQAILGSLKQLGFSSMQSVRVGKFITVELNAASQSEAEEQVKSICQRLLTNPVLEDYSFQLEVVS